MYLQPQDSRAFLKRAYVPTPSAGRSRRAIKGKLLNVRSGELRTNAAYGVDEDPDFVSKEFGALVHAGMTPLRAIQAATLNAAELLGKTNEIGAVEPGKYADLIAVQGDPLQDIAVMERMVFIMKGGAIIKDRVTKATSREKTPDPLR